MCFAAGQCRGVLPQSDIGQTNIHQRSQFLRDDRDVLEELGGIFHRHLKHFVNVLAFVANFQRLAVVALATAHIAGYVNVGQEMHFNFDDTVALARFASAAFDIETKATRHVTSCARFLCTREQLAYRRKQTTVSCRVRPRCAANRTLADINNPIDLFQSENFIVRRRIAIAAIQEISDRLVQCVIDQSRFAGTRDAGNARHQPNRNRGGYVLQIIAAGADNGDLALAVGLRSRIG